jgi:hypothetical protein
MHRNLAQNLHSSVDPLRSIENDSGDYDLNFARVGGFHMQGI